jgi:hypothetical protein
MISPKEQFMTHVDILEKLGMEFRRGYCERLAVMAAHLRFFLYNPTLLQGPLSVGEHLHEAQKNAKSKARRAYEFRFMEDSSFWDPKYSAVVLLTEDEGQEFLDYYDKAREYEKTRKTNTRAFHALEDAFEDLKSTYLERVPRNPLFVRFDTLEQN